jgi:hypothetical protein
MNINSKIVFAIFSIALAFAALAPAQATAQVLTGDQLKKAVPNSFFFSGQVAVVQTRNSAGFKNSAGKVVLAGLVDTTGYATAIAEKYQGFLITEIKLSFGNGAATLEPGDYGFGFKDGKLIVMNIAGAELVSAASRSDDQVKHPVPLRFEKVDGGYRLYAGRNYVVVKAE